MIQAQPSSNAPSAPWTAHWIEPVERADGPDVQRPVYLLVGTFYTSGVRQANLRITAHGIYEVFLNGQRVGDAELTPGFTAYRTRLQVQGYDVSQFLADGENVLGVRLSDGWWRGQNGIGRRTNAYGATTALLAELSLTHADGTGTVFTTNPSWLSTPSHVLGADLIAGEIHDLRQEQRDWALPGADRSSWQPVRVAEYPFGNLCDTLGPPVRRVQELPAHSVVRVSPQRHIVDFGQVSNGWVRLTDLGPAGTRLTLVHGECLTPSGDDVQIHALSGGDGKQSEGPAPSFQTDAVISAGDGAAFEPRHSTKGFRYLRIDGHPGPLDPATLTSIVVHTDVTPAGSFTCSDEDLNWLHTAADWSLRTNLCDIPTDCPTRERAGWTGDWQIYVDTASYLYDVADFSKKWLLDVAAEQLPSGAVLHFVPDPADHTAEDVEFWSGTQGSAGWGDAIVHVPWELYRATGDPDVLVTCFDGMCRWVDFALERAATSRHPDRVATRPDPGAHECYLWDTGFHFGEWNEPGNPLFVDDPAASEPQDGLERLAGRLRAIDHGATATAYLYRSTDELARIAAVIDDAEAAARYRAVASRVLAAWRTEFIDADGHVQPSTQPNLVRALAFGLVPRELRGRAVDDLVSLIRSAGTHLGTGFLATPFLLPVLADHGQLDLAYELLFQRTPPSWLAMRDQGATTIWEGWTPFDEQGSVSESLNHFSMGAVVGFLHRYIGGLQAVEPGYRRFLVAPRPGHGITWATTHHDSPYGRIDVAWQGDELSGRLDVTVPEGTTADILLPSGEACSHSTGRHAMTWTFGADLERHLEKEWSA